MKRVINDVLPTGIHIRFWHFNASHGPKRMWLKFGLRILTTLLAKKHQPRHLD